MTPFIAEIQPFAGNVPPLGWAFCDGQLLPVASNKALFSLLGNRFGGDGRINFALPDLRGRVPLAASDEYPQGTYGGQEEVALTEAHMPAHTHAAYASTTSGTRAENSFFGSLSTAISWGQGPGDLAMHPESIKTAGEGKAHENRMPFTAVSYIIALQGVYPPQN
ncbi:MAG: tail fiber protein [Chitinophagaceae bacterium]